MLHNLFEEKVANAPNNPALYFQNKIWSYEQLNTRANQLARTLLSDGIQPQDHVITRLERSHDQVIVFLALLKIGAIYVPLSIEQPHTRLEQMITDCAPKLIITNIDQPEIKTNASMPRIFNIQTEAGRITQASVANPQVANLSPESIAYVAYSSGTTGQPKGIPIAHAGMTEYWKPRMEENILHKAPRVLTNVSIDFDAHISEYLMAWTFGSTLYLTDNETRKDSEKLAPFIVRHHITDMTLTPTVLKTFTAQQINSFQSSGLKSVHSTGEACTPELVSKFAQHSIGIFNLYGPTEATFGLSMRLCKLEDFHHGIAPIALPPASSKIHIKIIDETGKEVADGETGELVIYSPYITKGYLNRAQSNRFENNSYKTGDKFLKTNDTLYYQGRLHNFSHIKIRGQYVDITGIENVLREHPAVQDVCVIVREDIGKDQDPMLVAFIVYKNPAEANANQLREYCLSKLSSTSIPVFFPQIQQMPRTIGSDKVDREKLGKTEFKYERDQHNPCESAINSTQEDLIAIWKDVLYASEAEVQIGITDVFTEVGGNSINTIYLIRKINEKYNISLSVAQLKTLEKFTIQHLAVLIQDELAKKEKLILIELAKKDHTRVEPLFLLPPISGESQITYTNMIEALHIPQDVYTIKGPSSQKLAEKNYSIPDLAALYLSSMRAVQPTRPLHIAGWSAGGLLVFEIARQAEAAGIPVAFAGIIDEPVPGFTYHQSPASFANELARLMKYFSEKHHFSIEIDVNALAALPKEEQIEKVYGQLTALPDLSQNIMDYVRTFLRATLTYQPTPLKSTPLTVFFTAKTRSEHKNTNDLNWKQYTSASVTEETIEGDHFSILEKPAKIAEKISRHAFPPSPLIKHTVSKFPEDMPKLELDETPSPTRPEVKARDPLPTPASSSASSYNSQTGRHDRSQHTYKSRNRKNKSPSLYNTRQQYPQEEKEEQNQLQQKLSEEIAQQSALQQLLMAQVQCFVNCQFQQNGHTQSMTMLVSLNLLTDQLTASQRRAQDIKNRLSQQPTYHHNTLSTVPPFTDTSTSYCSYGGTLFPFPPSMTPAQQQQHRGNNISPPRRSGITVPGVRQS